MCVCVCIYIYKYNNSFFIRYSDKVIMIGTFIYFFCYIFKIL